MAACVAATADVCRDQFGNPAPQLEWSAWLKDVEAWNEGVTRRAMTDDERIRFLGAYNDIPPVLDRNPERIEIISRFGDPQVIVVFVKNGCVTLTAVMFRALVESVVSPTGGGRHSLGPAEREA